MEQNKPVSENGLTIGSLFDGSGGFPFGGLLSGIQPIWASEIEPFPIRVTTKRLPFIKHYGDVSKMNGGEIEPVDIITFGSPCQDMSVAGKRAGLDGSRSNLFYEAVRIVREMRCATNGQKPRYIVWENVPGAFSSNKGEDFKAVLEAVCKIKDETYDVPKPPKGKWKNAGNIVADDFSIAWRVLDAQYWGVPQRRRRIFLVADFAGGGAGEILFEQPCVSGDIAESRNEGQGAAEDVERSVGSASGVVSKGNGEAFLIREKHMALACGGGQAGQGYPCVLESPIICSATQQAGAERLENLCPTITAAAGMAGNMGPWISKAGGAHAVCYNGENTMQSSGFCTEHSAKSRSVGYEEERSPTLRAGVVPATVMSFEPGAASRVGGHTDENLSGSLRANMGDNQTAVAIENHPTDSRVKLSEDNKVQTLTSRMGTGGMNVPLVMDTPKTLKIRSGCEGGGKGALIQDDKSATLGCDNDQTVFVPTAYGICSKDSNSMKSDNPHSGIYEADTSRTIDANGGNPGCNQGGIAVVESYALQGSMIGRQDKNGPQGDGINDNMSFTLNTVDRHGVVYAIDRETFNCGQNYAKNLGITEDGINSTLKARGPSAIATPTYTNYTVRRLTPTECARLQGFPDDWCYDLGTNNPSEDEILFWTEVWETHRQIMGKSSKPKTRKQIIKWLKNPHSDSAEYKMWGNGVALPCVCFVLSGIKIYSQESANITNTAKTGTPPKSKLQQATERLEDHKAQLNMFIDLEE